MELISPSKNIIQYCRIQIPAHMMNSDIEDNMTIVLQQKVESKCNILLSVFNKVTLFVLIAIFIVKICSFFSSSMLISYIKK